MSVGLRAEAAGVYHLDSGNTQVSFDVQRFGIQWVRAHFQDISGEFVLDRQGTSSRVDVIVGIASVDCDDPRWNDRLRSPEWLDAQRFPQMIYHADHIELGDGRATATGELTLHGVTRAVVLNVTFVNCESAATCHFTAHARIKRSAYGLPHGFWMGGDQVNISISGAVDGDSG
ncbi:MAG: YceI family protein [Steroidobacteraceae bacterium]